MTKLSLIAALPLLALTACGGASGPQSVGSNAPPASGGAPGTGGTGGGVTAPTPSPTPTATPTSSPSPSPTPTPTPTPGSGGSGGGVVGGGTTSPTPTPTHFLSVTSSKTFNAIGAFQGYETDAASNGILYRANASTVNSPTGSITYNPRDGVFTLNLSDTVAGVNSTATRFQDPGHRSDFPNFRTPEWGVPDLNGFNYLEAGSTETITDPNTGRTTTTTDALTFFYQRPGDATTYHVSLAGYVQSVVNAEGFGNFRRGAMVFGDLTPRGQIPGSGSGTYTGGFLATMVGNPTLDDANPRTNYFQWVAGDSSIAIDFSRATMSLLLTGKAMAANYNGANIPDAMLTVKNGAQFIANGSGVIDLLRTGGFTGTFQSARFVNPDGTVRTIDFSGISQGSSTAGASSIDGTFFGPNAVNVGGNFRVIGGIPDQRVDITGAFTGARK